MQSSRQVRTQHLVLELRSQLSANRRISGVKLRDAGADHVIDSVLALPDLIETLKVIS